MEKPLAYIIAQSTAFLCAGTYVFYAPKNI